MTAPKVGDRVKVVGNLFYTAPELGNGATGTVVEGHEVRWADVEAYLGFWALQESDLKAVLVAIDGFDPPLRSAGWAYYEEELEVIHE